MYFMREIIITICAIVMSLSCFVLVNKLSDANSTIKSQQIEIKVIKVECDSLLYKYLNYKNKVDYSLKYLQESDSIVANKFLQEF